MRKIILTSAILVMAIAVNAQNFTDKMTPQITVNGKAYKEVVPDEIFVSITINENDSKGKVTVAKQESDMKKELSKIGIDVEKQLSVADMDSDLKNYLLKKNEVMTSKSYSLKVSNAQTLSKVFEVLSTLGIADSRVVNVKYSKIAEINNVVRIEAIQNAKKIANDLATAIGQTIGNAILVTDYNNFNDYQINPVYPMLMKSSMAADASQNSSQPQIDFKKIRVNYSIQATFELK